jgi:predicted nuclease of predicted toxin-antitoxin system
MDVRLSALLSEGGHDVSTVLSEGLSGRSDEVIYEACLAERRTLITQDIHFANPARFPPAPSEGIVVIRSAGGVLPLVRAAIATALPNLERHTPKGALWIAEPSRIRIHRPDAEDEQT